MSWEEFCKNNKVPKKFKKCSLDTVLNKKEEIQRFIDDPSYSLILYGEPGRGKTYFLYSLIHSLIELKKAPLGYIRFFSGVDLEELMRENLKEYNSAKYLVESLSEVDCLFIDDFGVTSMADKAETYYYKLLDIRLNNELPTIISTNLDNHEILETFRKRIYSRLKFCHRLCFEGEDLRK